MEKIKVKVTIESVPLEKFTEDEIEFYFHNKLARSLCYKISQYEPQTNNTQQHGEMPTYSGEVDCTGVVTSGFESGGTESKNPPAETKHPIYKCGHRQETIFLDDNILSVCAYEMWVSNYGYRGDGSQCWDCYCKDSQPLSKKGFGRSYGYPTPNHEEANK